MPFRVLAARRLLLTPFCRSILLCAKNIPSGTLARTNLTYSSCARLEHSFYISPFHCIVLLSRRFFHSGTLTQVYVLLVYSFRDDRRWTPLLYVAAKGCPCCTKVLVEYGAKINEWDKNRVSNYTSVAVLWRSYCAKDLFIRVLDAGA